PLQALFTSRWVISVERLKYVGRCNARERLSIVRLQFQGFIEPIAGVDKCRRRCRLVGDRQTAQHKVSRAGIVGFLLLTASSFNVNDLKTDRSRQTTDDLIL